MARPKAVVLEVEGQSMTALTEDGNFIRLPRVPHAVPGTVVTVPPPRRRAWLSALAVAAVFFLCLSAALYGPALLQPAAAYLDLDAAGGSFRLSLDKNGQLRSVEALNSSSKDILRTCHLERRLDLDEALNRLIEEALETDASSPAPAVVVATLAPANEKKGGPHPKTSTVRTAITDTLNHLDRRAQVVVAKVDHDQYRQAQGEGLSVGRWLVAEYSRQHGASVNSDDAAAVSIPALLNRQDITAKGMFPDNCFTVPQEQTAIPPGQAKKGQPEDTPGKNATEKKAGSNNQKGPATNQQKTEHGLRQGTGGPPITDNEKSNKGEKSRSDLPKPQRQKASNNP